MSTRQTLIDEMKRCMKEQNKDRLAVIRLIITEIKNAEINDLKNPGRERTEEEVQALLLAYHKNLNKTLQEYPVDRQAPLKAEIAVLDEYLPKQLSQSEIEQALIAIVANATEKNFGLLMKAASAQLSGKADGRLIAETLKQLLAKA